MQTRINISSVRWTMAMSAFLFMSVAFLESAVFAQETVSLYTVEVPIDTEDPKSRDSAYERGLAQVLTRVSGSMSVSESEDLRQMFPNPARYVLQYRPGEDNSLWISFDGDAIENVLKQTGQTIWGADRPLTLVWLAVDWGGGDREIVAADDPDRSSGASRSIDRNRLLRERVADAAEIRGLPIAFPLMDAEDLERVSFIDIWGGFDELLLDASTRYGTNSILVGRIRPEAPHRNRWTYYFGGEQFTSTGEAEEVVNLIGETMAAQFAYSASEPLESVALTISGIDSVPAFGSVERLMDSLGLIREYSLRQVAGNRAIYSVQVHGGAEKLGSALQRSGVLEPVGATENAINGSQIPMSSTLEFTYSP